VYLKTQPASPTGLQVVLGVDKLVKINQNAMFS